MRVNFICLILAVFFLLAGCNTNEKPANNAVVETEKIVIQTDLDKADIIKIAEGMQILEGTVCDS